MAHEHHASTASPFSESEIEAMHADDRKAAMAIVGLMTGIFIIGVILYLIVCYSVK